MTLDPKQTAKAVSDYFNETHNFQDEQPQVKRKLTKDYIAQIATKYNLPISTVYAIFKIESKGYGFLDSGEPLLLFERHIYWRLLGKLNMRKVRRQMRRLRPDLCHRLPTKKGGYGSIDGQPQRLADAIALIKQVLPNVDDDMFNKLQGVAWQSASWGIGQLMGFNYQKCGFNSIDEFMQAMKRDEVAQFDAMIAFLTSNKSLLKAVQNKKFHTIARFYNGRNYRKFNYHKKLAYHDKNYQA